MPKLLIADGSPTMQRVIELTFAGEQMQIVSAADGEQAIALLPIARPDIVIADHALAGRSGYEIAAFVRDHPELSHVPVLLMAGAFEPVDRERASAAGAAGEIAKPFEPRQLVARVRELLTRPAPPDPAPVPVPVPASVPVPGLIPQPAPGAVFASGVAPRAPLKLVEPQAPARGALDDYFDRLDAALQRLDDQVGAPADEESRAIPTVDALLGVSPEARNGVDPPSSSAGELQHTVTAAPVEATTPRTDFGSLMAALEQLRATPAGPEVPATPAGPKMPAMPEPAVSTTVPASPAVTDAMVDEVTRRVLDRLAPGAVNQVVTQVVTRVAERLLREEIARLRGPSPR